MKKKYLKDKDTFIKVRISSEEKAKLIREASQNGMSLSEYIRAKLMAD